MQVKNFEDLEIWKDARALTRGIYQLQEIRNSQKISDCEIRSEERPFRSCQISQKGSNVEVTKSSFSFSTSQRHRAEKFARNFMLLSTNPMSQPKIATTSANLFAAYRS